MPDRAVCGMPVLLAFLLTGCAFFQATATAANSPDATRITPTPSPSSEKTTAATSAATAFPPTEEILPLTLPGFIPAVRAYAGTEYDAFQIQNLRDLGMEYVEGLADFSWAAVEGKDDSWNWERTDSQMDALAAAGLKTVPTFLPAEGGGLAWDPEIRKDDPHYLEEFGEFAHEAVARYREHPAWSGLVMVRAADTDGANSADPYAAPETAVPLLNAAYDGVKSADPRTIVIGFNLAAPAGAGAEWEAYLERALALSPRLDWFGVEVYDIPTTWMKDPAGYGGVTGLKNIRWFLNSHGYVDAPLWVGAGGFACGTDLGGLAEQAQAEQVVEALVAGCALGVDLRGWGFTELFSAMHRGADGKADRGLLTPLDRNNPPKSRPAWTALQTLMQKVRFFEFDFREILSGDFNQASPPFVYKFIDLQREDAGLWVVFSPMSAEPGAAYTEADLFLDISPALEARVVTMTGQEQVVAAGPDGTIAIRSTSSPIYIITGG